MAATMKTGTHRTLVDARSICRETYTANSSLTAIAMRLILWDQTSFQTVRNSSVPAYSVKALA
jgi:hypothetical protein